LQARDFLAQAFALGRDVDLDVEHDTHPIDDGDGRVRLRQRVANLNIGEPRECHEIGTHRTHAGSRDVSIDHYCHLLGGREPHLPAERPARVDQIF